MRIPVTTFGFAALTAGALTLAACDQATAPKGAVPVRFQLAAVAPSPSAASASGSQLAISQVQLVVGRAALGAGAEFGCVDCEGNFADEAMVSTLVNLPSAGGSVDVVTEQVSAGRYGQAELTLENPSSSALAAMTGAPAGTTLRVVGTFNGVPFHLDLAIHGTFRGTLNPPLDVTATGTSAKATVLIRLPVNDWFVSNGATLDPANTVDRTRIEANVRASFTAVEAEAHTSEG